MAHIGEAKSTNKMKAWNKADFNLPVICRVQLKFDGVVFNWRCDNVEDNKKVYYALVACGVLLVLAVCWYLFSEPDVSNQRERADDVGEELVNAGNAQRDAEKHLDSAGQRIDRSVELTDEIAGRIDEAAERIESVQERAESVAGILEDSKRRIEESKSIIQGIRGRARQNGK